MEPKRMSNKVNLPDAPHAQHTSSEATVNQITIEKKKKKTGIQQYATRPTVNNKQTSPRERKKMKNKQ